MTDSPYRIFRGADGRLRVEADPTGSAVVADFLFTDVREDAAHCDEVIDLIERARLGATGLEAIGNIYVLILDRTGARLENLHDETAPSAELGLNELEALLRQWRDQLA